MTQNGLYYAVFSTTKEAGAMLILGRKIGEKVMIGDNICVTLCNINGNQIRLGFEAPEDVAVHRKEVYVRVQKEKITPKTE